MRINSNFPVSISEAANQKVNIEPKPILRISFHFFRKVDHQEESWLRSVLNDFETYLLDQDLLDPMTWNEERSSVELYLRWNFSTADAQYVLNMFFKRLSVFPVIDAFVDS